MKVIRKELTAAEFGNLTDVRQNEGNPCVLAFSRDGGTTWTMFADLSLCRPADTIYRYNTITYIYEGSINDGATWFDAGGHDPRNTSPRVPVRTGGDPQCIASSNAMNGFKGIVNQCVAGIGEGLDLAGLLLIGINALALTGVAAPVPLVYDLMVAILASGVDVINAAMTDSVFAKWQCHIFCNMDANGQMSPAQFNQLQADLSSDISGLAYFICLLMDALAGAVGISNWGVTLNVGSDSGCAGCCPDSTCDIFDFQAGDYGFVPFGWTNAAGHTFDAKGFRNGSAGMETQVGSSGAQWIGMKARCHDLSAGGMTVSYNFSINSICSVEVRDHITGEVIHSRYIANTNTGARTDSTSFAGIGGTDVDIFIGAGSGAVGHIIAVTFFT